MNTLPEPYLLFAEWFDRAQKAQPLDANAMVVSSVDERGRPRSRVVLLKEFDARGFVFYTNQTSDKGRELAQNPALALLFWWPSLERQVRIEGLASKVPDAEADAYFATRPRGSQLGAWASLQSQELPSRAVLLGRVAEYTAKYLGRDVPRPPHWGGYRVDADRLEFWTGKPSRLHERLVFTRQGDAWSKTTLYP